jgi:hypothetical protein
LGYNPILSIVTQKPVNIPSGVLQMITSDNFFPQAIAPAFMNAHHVSFYFGALLSVVVALLFALKGKVFVH